MTFDNHDHLHDRLTASIEELKQALRGLPRDNRRRDLYFGAAMGQIDAMYLVALIDEEEYERRNKLLMVEYLGNKKISPDSNARRQDALSA